LIQTGLVFDELSNGQAIRELIGHWLVRM